jgi:hypothetical protein
MREEAFYLQFAEMSSQSSPQSAQLFKKHTQQT